MKEFVGKQGFVPSLTLSQSATVQQPRYKTLMLVENNYPLDSRVRNQATRLLESGVQVSVIAFKDSDEPWTETVNGVHVYRIPRLELFDKTPSEDMGFFGVILLKLRSFLGYLIEYGYFTTGCLLMSVWVLLRRGFDAIHAHNPPDTLFLVALPFRLIGKKFIFDHHDLCPELYRSRYGAKEGLLSRMLFFFEWCSLKVANITIATNQSYKEIQIQRGGKRPETVFIVRNGPNAARMTVPPPNQQLRAMNKKILCYIGSLNPQDGVDYLIRSLAHLLYDLKREDFYCVIMGSGDSLNDLRAQAKALKLDNHVQLTGFISDADLLANLAAADICVDPDPSSPLNDVSTWIKIMEYMAFSKPIVSFDLKETRFSAQDAALFVPPNDEMAFAKGIATLMDDPARREQMGRFGRDRVERELQWSVAGRNIVTAYESLFKK
jgi:glycosyltransferase involved in cell wall biosynthesis